MHTRRGQSSALGQGLVERLRAGLFGSPEAASHLVTVMLASLVMSSSAVRFGVFPWQVEMTVKPTSRVCQGEGSFGARLATLASVRHLTMAHTAAGADPGHSHPQSCRGLRPAGVRVCGQGRLWEPLLRAALGFPCLPHQRPAEASPGQGVNSRNGSEVQVGPWGGSPDSEQELRKVTALSPFSLWTPPLFQQLRDRRIAG